MRRRGDETDIVRILMILNVAITVTIVAITVTINFKFVKKYPYKNTLIFQFKLQPPKDFFLGGKVVSFSRPKNQHSAIL